MQVKWDKNNLPKRSSYYHSMMVVDNAKRRENFQDLKDSYVIFICDFDPFGANMYKYTVHSVCEETKERLNDGITTIFLNTRGKRGEISQELKNFLDLVRENAVKDDDAYVQEIYEEVKEVNQNNKWRKDKMSLQLLLESAECRGEKRGVRKGKIEGREEGKEKGIYNAYELLKETNMSEKDCLKAIANQYDMPVSEVKNIIKKFK